MSNESNVLSRGIGRNSNSTRGGSYTVTDAERVSILATQVSVLRQFLAANNKTIDKVGNYTDLYNSWLPMSRAGKERTSVERIRNIDGELFWHVHVCVEWGTPGRIVKISASVADQSKKLAFNEVHKRILMSVWRGGSKRIPKVQMDNVPSKESVQGDVTQESVKDSNTIITRDQAETIAPVKEAVSEDVVPIASSEPTEKFKSLVGRWMPLNSVDVTTSHSRGSIVATYNCPEDLLIKYSKCAPNNIPFETFVYGQFDLEFKFVVNANKFNTGKLIAAVRFDPLLSKGTQIGYQAFLGRPHVILDLTANNQAILKVPFRFHRAFVRNYPHSTSSKGIRTAIYATVELMVLSPLTTGSGGSNNIDVRVFYRYSRADFAGMSYRVPLTQMDTLLNAIPELAPEPLRHVLRDVENTFTQFGKSRNQDKPTRNDIQVFVPRPRMNFVGGKGFSDAIPLRNNPYSLTSYSSIKAFPDDPKTTIDIARIWGIRSAASWSATATQGSVLFDFPVDPTMRLTDANYVGAPTPLEYMCGMYNFWSGPIELRLDFVSNSFHTGAVTISAEFNRTSKETDQCESQSTYTKTFHLGDQKSVSFVVPYIFDTVWRRTSNAPFLSLEGDTTSDDIKYSAPWIRPDVKTRIKVRVLNVLRPVATAPQSIDMLMFWRAGENFHLHSPVQQAFRIPWDLPYIGELKSFPKDDFPTMITYVHNLPKVQMDTGEKENEDKTRNFGQGKSSKRVQTSDHQLSIKDILRRPVCLFTDVEVDKDKTAFFLPVMPPSFEWSSIKSPYKEVFSQVLRDTPQASLINLFRFWRGSSRYTIVCNDATTPVYVTYMPHSGVRIIGNNDLYDKTGVTFTRPIWSCGMMSDMIIPQVNPTSCFEVPYDTENNWTYTWQTNVDQDLAWRDVGDTNAGHICISSPYANTKVSVWWAAGDDFEVANFYGIPSAKSDSWAYAWSDEHGSALRLGGIYRNSLSSIQAYEKKRSKTPQTQADNEDFSDSNRATKVSSFLKPFKSLFQVENAAKIAISAVPVVGPAYTAATLMNSVVDVKDSINSVTTATVDKLNEITSATGVAISTIMEMVKRTCDTIENSYGKVALITGVCTDAILDIFVAWYDQSWVALGVGVVRALCRILKTTISTTLIDLGRKIGEVVSTIISPLPSTQAEGGVNLTALIVSVVGTIIGAKLDPSGVRSLPLSVLKRLTTTTGVNYIFSVFKIIELIFVTAKDTILYWLGFASPETQAVKMLAKSSPLVDKFVTEAQIITSEANSSLLLTPGFRTRFWYAVMQALQIQKLLMQVPNNIASPHLARLCTEVIRLGNEKFMDISASPVRYEPFVICIEGAPGIGKSDCVEALVNKMLAKINLSRPHSGATYYRSPGSPFWSGYKDQPVVVYDDWMNLADPERVVTQLSELYTLKSTSIFIPNMAHLEEKKIRGNPLIVVLLCNSAFPDSVLNSAALHKSAIYRRRDIVLHARRKNEYSETNLRSMSIEEQENIAHLELTRYTDSANIETKLDNYRDFSCVSDWISKKFEVWHKQESIKVKRRFKLIQAGMEASSINSMRIEDPFDLYYNIASQPAVAIPSDTAAVPSEILQLEVTKIVNMLNANQVREEVEDEVVVDTVEDIFEAMTRRDTASDVVHTQAGRHILNNRWICDKILGLGQAGIAYLAEKVRLLIPPSEITNTCPVCREEKVLKWICRSSLEVFFRSANESACHRICGECYEGIVATTRSVQCPVCRASDMEPCVVMDLTHYTWGVSLVYLVVKGLSTVKTLLGILKRIFGFEEYGVTAFAFDCLRLVRSTITKWGSTNRDEQLDMLTSASNVVNGLSVLINNVARTQADDPWDDPVEDVVVEEVNTPETVFRPELNLAVVSQFQVCSTDTSLPCLHGSLKDWIPSLRYIAGRFHVPAPGMAYDVDERPCSITCWLTVGDNAENFYRDLLRAKEAFYSSKIAAYYSAVSNKEYYKDQVPRALRPTWMDGGVAQQEVEQLQSQPWYMFLGEVWDNYKYAIIAITGLSSGLIAMYGLRSMFTNLPGMQGQSDDDYDPSDQYKTIRGQVKNVQRVRPVRHGFTRTQVMEDDTPLLAEVVKKNILRNTMTMIILEEGKIKRQLTITGICGRVSLLPRHYVKVIKEAAENGRELRLGPSLVKYEQKQYTYSPSDFRISSTTDLALFILPKTFSLFKDIRKYFIKDDDLMRPMTSSACLIIGPNARVLTPREVSVTVRGMQSTQEVEDADGEKFLAADVMVYNYSQPGVCGSLLMLDRTQRPLCAMHFAGSGEGLGGEGYGVIITQESLDEVNDLRSVVQMDEELFCSIDEAKVIFPEEVKVTYLGALTTEETPYVPQKSKIRPSLIQNIAGLKPKTEPTILAKSDIRYTHTDSPLYAGAKKHGKLTVDFPSHEVAECAQALWDMFYVKMKPLVAEPKYLTPVEACVGLKGLEYYDPIKLSTSAGWPYVTTQYKSKSDYIEFEVDEDLRPINAKIKSQVLDKLFEDTGKRRQGVVPITKFVDSLKDERRKPEKVRSYGGTRVFCNPPVEYVIAQRQNTLHFTSAFMSQRFELQHAVGINAHGEEWTRLYNTLSRRSKHNIIALDYSNFGPGFNGGVAAEAVGIMKRWLLEHVEGADSLELECIFEECINSVHICTNTVYQQRAGSPSGAPITTVINSLVNQLYVLLAWNALYKGHEYKWKEYQNNVTLFVYGDDLIMSVSDDVLPFFNGTTITDYFSKYHIVATSSVKTESVKTKIHIDEATFLKRSFRPHPYRRGIIQSLLDWDTIYDIPLWIAESADLRKATLDNVETALEYVHGWGPEVFAEWKDKWNRALVSIGLQTAVVSWEEIDNKFYNNVLS